MRRPPPPPDEPSFLGRPFPRHTHLPGFRAGDENAPRVLLQDGFPDSAEVNEGTLVYRSDLLTWYGWDGTVWKPLGAVSQAVQISVSGGSTTFPVVWDTPFPTGTVPKVVATPEDGWLVSVATSDITKDGCNVVLGAAPGATARAIHLVAHGWPGGIGGVPGGATDHGQLTGLSDDDHLQYPLAPRAKVRVVAPSGAPYPDPKAAIEACAAGDVVLILAGTYTLTSTITVPANNITILGASRDGVVLNNTAGSAQNVLDVGSRTGLILRDFTIQAAVGNTGITGAAPDDLLIENVKIVSTAFDRGISLSTPTRVRIIRCYITGPFSYAPLCLLGGSQNVVSGCHLVNSGSGYIAFLYCPRSFIVNNVLQHTLSGFAQLGIYVNACSYLTIAGNVIEATTAPGTWYPIYIRATTTTDVGHQVTGNLLISSGGAGVLVQLCTQSGGYLDDVMVGHNFCKSGLIGVRMSDAGVREAMVVGNNLHSCTTAYSDSGTSTYLADNS